MTRPQSIKVWNLRSAFLFCLVIGMSTRHPGAPHLTKSLIFSLEMVETCRMLHSHTPSQGPGTWDPINTNSFPIVGVLRGTEGEGTAEYVTCYGVTRLLKDWAHLCLCLSPVLKSQPHNAHTCSQHAHSFRSRRSALRYHLQCSFNTSAMNSLTSNNSVR